jgi:uncharacterized protein YjbI with pentapeptide repeats
VKKKWHNVKQCINQHWLKTLGIVTVVAVGVFILAANKYKWEWTGIPDVPSKQTTVSASEGAIIVTEVQFSKTLWDWLGLLSSLAVPVVVGLGAAWYTVQQGKVRDREVKDNQQEAALQGYFDKISELLLHEHLGERTTEGLFLHPAYTQVRNVARVRTITVLTQLDARRVGRVFTFLREAGLLSATSNDNVISLKGTDFRKVNWSEASLYAANLQRANLSSANLQEANLIDANLQGVLLVGANLQGAQLMRANLVEANLFGANLQGAFLAVANLQGSNLYGAFLKGAYLEIVNFEGADLREANFEGADLQRANLQGAQLLMANLQGAYLEKAEFKDADLEDTDLSGAYLKDATGITPEQLATAKSLKGAIMPDGSIHP